MVQVSGREEMLMKKTVFAVFGAAALVLGMSSAAKASALLTLSNGGTTLSCNTSQAVVAGGNCDPAFFAIGSNINGVAGDKITFLGGNVGGYNVSNVTLTGNQPGSSPSFALDTKTAVTNVSAGTSTLTVNFAENDYSLPLGSPLSLSASQSATFTVDPLAVDNEDFTGYGNSANTLAIAGVADTTPNCKNPSPNPQSNQEACGTAGVPTTFSRSGNFALAGSESIHLAQGDTASFTATVDADAVPGVPEPASMFLLGTGLLGLAAKARNRFGKKG
jgi:hypothetical protein